MIPDEQLDFEACVQSGQVFRFVRTDSGWEGVDGDNLIRATKVSGGWEVESAPDSRVWERFLQIDRDLLEIRDRIARIEPRLVPIMAELPGLRTLRPALPEETLFSFLCTANNNMTRIVRMVGFLASKGREVEKGHHIFPKLMDIGNISEDELRQNGFGYRGATIPRVARDLGAREPEWLTQLKGKPYLQARAELSGLHGIGLKLADCVCLFGLHFDEAVPIDTHVWKTLSKWYAPHLSASSLTPSRYAEASCQFRERFGPLSGWAQQYVFYNQYKSYRKWGVKQV